MRRILITLGVALALPAAAEGQARPYHGRRVEATHAVVAAAHPAAADAGLAVLQAGGNAVDAAVAAAFAIGVAEPMMSGVGGGGTMTVWLQQEQTSWSVDFYPAAGADPDPSLDSIPEADRGTMPERWVAVPGAVAGLLDAQQRLGVLPRAAVLEPAIRLARQGVRVHPMLARAIREERDKLLRHPGSAAAFYPDSAPLETGAVLRQPELAATLEAVRDRGRDGFYAGPVADEIIRVLSGGGNRMTLEDLAAYAPRWQRPVCAPYRGFTVLAAAPPLSGLQVVETLRLLERLNPDATGLPTSSAPAAEALVASLRLARADRDRWLGDPRDGTVPATALVGDRYVADRAGAAAAVHGGTPTVHGDPWSTADGAPTDRCAAIGAFEPAAARPAQPGTRESDGAQGGETTHLSVVDADGNAVALTITIGNYFGYGAYAAGAFFNDAMENFGGADANRRAPHRTPRSATAPTILLDRDGVRLVVGSPGGHRITPAIVQTIMYALDYGLDVYDAVAMPRLYVTNGDPAIAFESGFDLDALAPLRDRGFVLMPSGDPLDYAFGGVHAILVREDGTLIGAADPRRDGVAVGW